MNTRLILACGLGLVALAATSLWLAAQLFEVLNSRAALAISSRDAVLLSDQLPPEPRLQVDSKRERRELRAAEQQQLGSYAWVNRKKKQVRIPIERAMEILVERDLPVANGAETRR